MSRKRGETAHLRKVERGENATTKKTKEEECRNGSESWDSVPLWKGDERAMPFTGAVTRDAAKPGLRNGTESRFAAVVETKAGKAGKLRTFGRWEEADGNGKVGWKQNRNFYYLYKLNSLSKKR